MIQILERFLSILQKREAEHRLRHLSVNQGLVDFCSNDYLGLARSELLWQNSISKNHSSTNLNGSAGSRLLAGNSAEAEILEKKLADFHKAESALLFNSGYEANLGFYSTVPQKGDIILYDELVHASIRDGIRLSTAKSFSFRHNSVEEMLEKLQRVRGDGQVFLALESVYSMDGDLASLGEFGRACNEHHLLGIVDEAHSTGLYGTNGEGLVQELSLENAFFARLHTFGKAIGCHGAAIVGPTLLKDYLINFCRQFIYTTALPPHAINSIREAYSLLPGLEKERGLLRTMHSQLLEALGDRILNAAFSPIVSLLVPGNESVRRLAQKIQQAGYDVRPIMSPTVALGAERLRICLHSYNTEEEIQGLFQSILENL